jgi:hypothetical protein
MLNTISWTQYFSFISIAVILYYVFVWIVYFKGKLPSLMMRQETVNHSVDVPAHALAIIPVLESVFQQKYNKQELMMVLKNHLKQYDATDEDMKEAINKVIVAECMSKCSIHLGEEDLRVLWMR